MVRVARGDREALGHLYNKFSGLLVGIAMRVVGERSAAEDLLQDLFVETWKRAGTFDPSRGTVRGWLSMRMRSRAIDRVRSPRNARTVGFDEETSDRAVFIFDVDQKLSNDRVRSALSSLSSQQRELVELCYFRGLSMDDAAERLCCPAGTVKSRLSTARDVLRRALADLL